MGEAPPAIRSDAFPPKPLAELFEALRGDRERDWAGPDLLLVSAPLGSEEGGGAPPLRALKGMSILLAAEAEAAATTARGEEE
jgi:hypothetical protein